jgi:hypothetical protein
MDRHSRMGKNRSRASSASERYGPASDGVVYSLTKLRLYALDIFPYANRNQFMQDLGDPCEPPASTRALLSILIPPR